jgi:uncharacterized repeat protein (TIGR02543 family)
MKRFNEQPERSLQDHRNPWRRALSLLLVFCMTLTMTSATPVLTAYAQEPSDAAEVAEMDLPIAENETTVDPEPTVSPEPTPIPESTTPPEPTASPETTPTTEPTPTPEPTDALESTPTPEPTATPEPTPALYPVVVSGGAGSGDYEAGATITITADTPEAGSRFTGWAVADNTVSLADSAARITTFIMPEGAVTITANTEPWLPSQGEHYTTAQNPFTITAMPGFTVSTDAAAWAASATWGEETAGSHVNFYIMNTATEEISGVGSEFYPLPEVVFVMPMIMDIQAQVAATATMGGATISGIVGKNLPGKGFSVSLDGDIVKEDLMMEVTSWFNNSGNFPSGVTVDAVAFGGDSTIMFYFTGTPASESTAEIGGLTIPGSALSSGQQISVDGNPDAKFNIIYAPEYPETPTVTIAQQPDGLIYNPGDSITPIIVSASVSDGGELSYQWYVDRSEISGATSDSYTPPSNLSGQFYYHCEVTNTNLDATVSQTATAKSDDIVIIVNPPVNAQQPTIEAVGDSQSATYTLRDPATPLTVSASVTDGGELSYQWYLLDTPIEGATSSTYTPPTDAAASYVYYCVVTNTNSKATDEKTVWVPSELITITVNPPENAATPILGISVSPQDATYTIGQTAAALTVAASSPDGGALTYQWHRDNGILVGETSSTITPSTTTAGTYVYYCVVTNTNEDATVDKTTSAESERITITVNGPENAAMPIVGVSVTTQDAFYTIGQPATPLTVSASSPDGGVLSYQWYSESVSIEGATSSTYTPPTDAAGEFSYHCKVTNTNANATQTTTATNTSETIIITIVAPENAAAPVLDETGASQDATYTVGDAAAPLTVSATSPDGGELSYIWYIQKSSIIAEWIPGETNATFTPPTDVAGSFVYYCGVTNTNNNATNNDKTTVAYSTPITITVNEPIPSATMGSATISGEVGTRFLRDQSVVITLANETVVSNPSYADASGWFANLPETGLNVKANGDYFNNQIITLMFSGTPTTQSTAALGALTIPGGYLASGEDLPVAANDNAVFAIGPESTEPLTATIGDFTASGSAGDRLVFQATVTMNDACWDVPDQATSWFTGLPTGTWVGIENIVENTITLQFVVEPTVAYAGHFGAGGGITMKIPGEFLTRGQEITVSPNPNAKITITGAEGGITATPQTLNFGTAELGYTEAPAAQVVTFTNTSDHAIRVERIALETAGDFDIYINGFKVITHYVHSSGELDSGASIEVTVQPIKGLDQGGYTDNLGFRGHEPGQGNVQTLAEASLSFNVTPARSASMGSATISGEVGTMFLSDQTVVITLANDTVAHDPAYADASGWFTDLPDTGLEVRAMVDYPDGVHFDNQHIMLKFRGRPTAESTAALGALVIPGRYLASGRDLPVAANAEAVFAIGPESTEVFTAEIGSFTATGTVGRPMHFNATLTVTDTLLDSSASLTDWFTGLPAGLDVSLSPLSIDNSIVLMFIGSPTSASAAHFGAGGGITMKIPGEYLAHGKDITVSPNPNAKFIITGAEGGIIASPETLDFGSALLGYTELPDEQTVTVTNLSATSIPLDFIRMELPETSFSFVSTALPSSLASGESMQITMQPKDDLAAMEHENALLIGYTDAAGEKTLEIPLTFTVLPRSASIGDVTISGTEGSNFVDQQTTTITLANDTLKAQMQYVDAKGWAASFTATGLGVAANGASGGSQIELQFSGKPPAAYAEAFGSITIPGTYLTSGLDLVVTENENATFSIVEETRGTPSATIDDVVIRGSKGGFVNATATVRLQDDVMPGALYEWTVTPWFTGLPAGVRVTASFSKYGDTITLRFAGTALEVSAANFGAGGGITMTIPGDYLVRGIPITVSPNPDAKFIITGEGGGMTATPNTLVFDTAPLRYQTLPAKKTVTITNLGTDSIPLDFIRLKSSPSNFSFTPTELPSSLNSGESIQITVQPVDGLALGNHTNTLGIQYRQGAIGPKALEIPLSFTVAQPPTALNPVPEIVINTNPDLALAGTQVIIPYFRIAEAMAGNYIAAVQSDDTSIVTANTRPSKSTEFEVYPVSPGSTTLLVTVANENGTSIDVTVPVIVNRLPQQKTDTFYIAEGGTLKLELDDLMTELDGDPLVMTGAALAGEDCILSFSEQSQTITIEANADAGGARSAFMVEYTDGGIEITGNHGMGFDVRITDSDATEPVTLNVTLDGAPYEAHGKTFTLRQGETSILGSGTDGTVIFAAPPGTYTLYDGDTNTGILANVQPGGTTITAAYVSPPFAGGLQFALDATTGAITALLDEEAETGDPGDYTYTWLGEGVLSDSGTATLTQSAYTLGKPVTVNVSREGYTGMQAGVITVYKVELDVSGFVGLEGAILGSTYTDDGNSVAINYTLLELATTNTLTFGGEWASPVTITTPGSSQTSYPVAAAADADGDGIFEITATFDHPVTQTITTLNLAIGQTISLSASDIWSGFVGTPTLSDMNFPENLVDVTEADGVYTLTGKAVGSATMEECLVVSSENSGFYRTFNLTIAVAASAPQAKDPVSTQYIYVPTSSDTAGHTAFLYASEIAFGSYDMEIASINTGDSSKVTGSVENGKAVLSSVALGEQSITVTVSNILGETQISVPVVVLLQPRDVLVIGGTADRTVDVEPGSVVIVTANASQQGKRFTGFTADLDDLAFIEISYYVYSFAMPEQNVTITANYETWNLTEGVEYTLPNGGTKDAEGNIDWLSSEMFLVSPVDGYYLGYTPDEIYSGTLLSSFETTINGADVTFYAKNNATGEISAAKTVTFYQDKTAPTTPTLAGAQGHSVWEINPVTLTVSASDALSGIASFEYTLDAEESWSNPIPWNAEGDNTFTISDSGAYAHLIHVRVSDAAGNTATSEAYTVLLNTEPLVGDFSIGINPETGDLTAKRTTGLWHNWSGEGVTNSRTDTLLREAYTLGETITLTLTDPITHRGAQFDLVVYPVTFNGNGSSSTVYCFKDIAVGQPDDPARDGYAFKGWSTDATNYTAYDFDTPITAATTLYAHWTELTYSASIMVMKDGLSWHQSSSGKAFTLINDSNAAEYPMEARKGLNVYSAAVPNGSYSVFNGSVDTGVDITIYRAANDATLNYYTITYAASPAGVSTTGASITTATYDGAAIDNNTVVLPGKALVLTATPSGADRYTYLWSGTGVPADQKAATLTISSLSGQVDATCTITGSDDTAPTGSISFGGKSWTTASTFIPYDLFFKEAVTVTLDAEDNIDEEVKVEYLTITQGTVISGWQAYSAPFTIPVGTKAIVHARLTDDSGNETRINSSGVVVYADAAQDTQAIAFAKLATADVTASVTLNGNTIAGIMNGEDALTLNEDYTVSGNIITFKASYLDSLDASETAYTFTISYNPLGVTYVAAEGNAAPATTTIALTVSLAIQSPVAITDPGIITYGDPDFTLEATGGNGTGAYVFSVPENPYLDVDAQGNVTIKAATNGATVTVSVYKEASGDYGQSETATRVLTVARKVIEAPRTHELTYTGWLQRGVFGGEGYALSGVYWAVNAGNYAATATPDDNHQWSDGENATAPRTIAWRIARRNVAVPTVKTPLVYTGQPQTAVESDTGYTVFFGTATEPGTYMAFATPDDNHQWPDGSIVGISLVFEILPAVIEEEPGDSQRDPSEEILLVVDSIAATDPQSIAFAQKRPAGASAAQMYEAKLRSTITGEEYALAQGITYLIELVDPATGAKEHVLLRENADGTFDCVLVGVDVEDIVYPVTDFTRYGTPADEVYIEGIAPHENLDLDGWAYWVWMLDTQTLILRIQAE